MKLALLSRLKLSEDEIAEFQNELSEILDYVRMLDNVDTDGLEPTYQVTGLSNVTRKDEAYSYQAGQSELLKNAPAVVDNQFKVPRVL